MPPSRSDIAAERLGTTMDHPKTVLAIDDDAGFLVAVAELLKAEQYLVWTASDPAEGWNLLERQKPGVVILDWNMPGADGISFLRRIRSSPGLRDLYTIMVTARSDSADVLRGIREGADDYLPKPFDNAELIARIEVGFRTRALQDELAEQIRKATMLEMAGAVAHEIGNPLAGATLLHLRIAQYAEVTGNPELARDVAALQGELQRIEALVRKAQSLNVVKTLPYADALRIVDLHDGGKTRGS